jgi:hypothetical protein
MNWKKLFIAFIAAFVFIFLFEWLLHGVFLKDAYTSVQNLMRPKEEFGSHFHWLVLGEAIMVFMFTVIYARGFADGGVPGGVRLGVMLAVTYIGADLITYAVQPFPGNLIVIWSVAVLIEYAIAGAIVGAIYKAGSARSSLGG